MCGIFCAVSKHQQRWPTEFHQRLLENRGPDSCCKANYLEEGPVKNAHSSEEQTNAAAHITFLSTVLSLRGIGTVQQPYRQSDQASRLCWNGEAWTVNGTSTDGNDTQLVFDTLLEATQAELVPSETDEATGRANAVARTLSRVGGPYAFVFHDTTHGLTYFGRDFLGRRSLLIKITEVGDVLLSSVADGTPGWTEVEADGIYCIDLRDRGSKSSSSDSWTCRGNFASARVPYCFPEDGTDLAGQSVLSRLSLNKQLPQEGFVLHEASPSVQHLEQLLRESLSLRVLNIPKPPCVQLEVQGAPSAKLAVLFSGGLDCTLLARLTHDLLPIHELIDLLNVAFENPRIHKTQAGMDCGARDVYELCPDRVTGRATYAELQRVCPGRKWNFVAINVPYHETMEHRERVIALMHPHNTEMDLSISYALYFAARGIGHVAQQDATTGSSPYTTSARVLLSGLGADELFGGYQRHATAYNRYGFDGLLSELELDVSRLGKRNLGRDDRVISNWGREARFPFLDEHFLAWALAAPVTEKCGFGEMLSDETGNVEDESALLEPGKKILRCLAWKLGMTGAAKEKKRAIQFGARTAKMETGKTKGTHVLS